MHAWCHHGGIVLISFAMYLFFACFFFSFACFWLPASGEIKMHIFIVTLVWPDFWSGDLDLDPTPFICELTWTVSNEDIPADQKNGLSTPMLSRVIVSRIYIPTDRQIPPKTLSFCFYHSLPDGPGQCRRGYIVTPHEWVISFSASVCVSFRLLATPVLHEKN